MASVLALFHNALKESRHYWKMGRLAEMHSLLTRLTRFNNLPQKTAEKLQYFLGRVAIKQKRFRRARRHFAICLAHDPKNANYLYWLGRALAGRGNGNLQAAAEEFRNCLKLNPTHLSAMVFLGITLCKQNNRKGLEYLREAAALQPRKVGVLRRLVRMLHTFDLFAEAVDITTRALFQNHGKPEFLTLRNYARFLETRMEQERKGRNNAVLLPFLKIQRDYSYTTRTDSPELLPTPYALKARKKKKQRRFK